MANLNDLRGQIRIDCGDATGLSYDALGDTALMNYCNQACMRICELTGLLRDDQDYTTVADQMLYALAKTTFLKPIACEWNRIRLKRRSWDQILHEQTQDVDGKGGAPSSGSPEYFCVHQGQLALYPPPETAGQTATLHFVAGPTVMTAGTHVPFYGASTPTDYNAVLLYHSEEAIVAGAEIKVWGAMGGEDRKAGNIDGARYCQGKAQEAAARFRRLLADLKKAAGPVEREEMEFFDVEE